MISLKKKKRKIPLSKALRWIVFSTFLVSGTTAAILLYTSHVYERQKSDPAFFIQEIALKNGPLEADFFAELLDLSIDSPTNIHYFNTIEAERKLLSFPLLKSVRIKKEMPSRLKIDYVLRTPFAKAADWQSGAWDETYHLIPLTKFDTLPSIYTGENKGEWGKPFESQKLVLAFEMIRWCSEREQVLFVDVSKTEGGSLGKREVILNLERAVLRLHPERWREGILDYQKIKERGLLKSLSLIDLRIPNLAFIKEIE